MNLPLLFFLVFYSSGISMFGSPNNSRQCGPVQKGLMRTYFWNKDDNI